MRTFYPTFGLQITVNRKVSQVRFGHLVPVTCFQLGAEFPSLDHSFVEKILCDADWKLGFSLRSVHAYYAIAKFQLNPAAQRGSSNRICMQADPSAIGPDFVES
jgi:hypothetical protein